MTGIGRYPLALCKAGLPPATSAPRDRKGETFPLCLGDKSWPPETQGQADGQERDGESYCPGSLTLIEVQNPRLRPTPAEPESAFQQEVSGALGWDWSTVVDEACH